MRPTSPIATAGVGHDLEAEIGAHYLAALLLEGTARGSSGGTTVSVSFQRAALDAPLDDLKVETESAVGRVRLDLQIKRRFTFSSGDRKFAPVINACWDTFIDPSFHCHPGNRFGVAILNASKRVKEFVEEVARWAQSSTSAADFFTRIQTEHLSRKDMREFVAQVKAQVGEHTGEAPNDEALRGFFQRLVVVDFDVESPASRDRANTIETLRKLVPGGSVEEATALLGHLRDAPRFAGRTSGGFTEQTLREHLLRQSVAILAPLPFRNDLDRLKEHTKFVLGSIQNAIEGLVLDRSTAIEGVLARVDDGQTVFLSGKGGVGKSAILRAVGEARPCVALSGKWLPGDLLGWNGLATTLGLHRRLDELVLALSGTDRPCLLIDGAEWIEGAGARQAVNDFLGALGRLESSAGLRWAIVITTRDETLATVRAWLELPGERTADLVSVPDLTAEEFSVVADRLPYLRWILASNRVKAVIGNAYFLRVLAQSRAEAPADLQRVTEAYVQSLWWECLVGPDRARQQEMLQLGERSLAGRTFRLLAGGIDPAVLSKLEVDGILRRDPRTDTYWFGHDILEEWTLARVLGQHDLNVIEYLRSQGAPFWVARALQLLACVRLEEAEGGELWRDLLRQAEADPAADMRWVEAVLTAPLRSARLAELMPIVGETLLAGDGSRLARFLRAVRTQEIEPNRELVPLAEHFRISAERLEALTLEMGYPRVHVWLNVLRWLVPRLQLLPVGLREEVSQLMVTWQRTTPPGSHCRRELAEAALAWHGVLRSSSGEWCRPAQQAEPYFDRLRDIVILAADAIPERIGGFLEELKQTRRRSDLGRWLARPQPALARYAAAAYADFSLDVLVPSWREEGEDVPERGRQNVARRSMPFSHRDEDPEWARLKGDHDFSPPSQLRGPFLLVLEASEADGLRLIHTLVNRATEIYLRRIEGRPNRFEMKNHLDFSWGTREFEGGIDVYRWFRPNGGAPSSVCSALMALEVWMEKQSEAGREPEGLFQAVLSGSESVATVAVCVAISLAYGERFIHAATPFVSSSLLWEFDISRRGMDSHGTIQLLWEKSDPMVMAAVSRDQRPQRSRAILDLMPIYASQLDLALRDQVFDAVRNFSDGHFSAFGNPADYKNGLHEGARVVWFEPPPVLQERQAQVQRRLDVINPRLELSLWAAATLKKGIVNEGMTLAGAIERAQALEQPEDFTQPIEMDGDYNRERLQGIVGVAAAAVVLDIDWTQSSGYLAWCKKILVAAAETPAAQGGFSEGSLPGSVRSSAAKGLMALLQNRLADELTRLAAFRLLQSSQNGVVDIIFGKIRELWDVDPVFCRNAVARELALVVRPRGKRVGKWDVDNSGVNRWKGEIEERFLENVRQARIPDAIELRRKPGGEFRNDHVRRALEGVPFERVADGTERAWVLQVTDAAFAWTLAQFPEEIGSVQQFGYDWLFFLGEWLAQLAGTLAGSEVESHLLAPLRSSWPGSAPITASLLHGYTVSRLIEKPLSEATKREWMAIADWVLATDSAASPRRAIEEALELLIHVRHSHAVRGWTGAPEFVEIYGRWVEAFAHYLWAFRALLAFVGEAGSRLGAKRILGWLAGAVKRMEDRERLWREDDTGRSTAEALAALWSRSEVEIRRDAEALRQYADLLEELKRAGVPLAARLLSSL